MPSTKPHVCFVAPNVWPVLVGETAIPTVGGAEVQQALLARALVANGHRVSIICLDYGQADVVSVDGIACYKTHIPVDGIPVIRFFHPRLTSIWKAMKRVNADIYYQRAAGVTTGIAALFAKCHGRRFVYAAAHDLDLARDRTWELFQRRAGWRDRQLFTLGVKLADAVVAQHEGQAVQCRRWYGRTPAVIPSCYAKPAGARAARGGYVLWVSTLRLWKRPELFLELARRLPQLQFRLVGGEGIEASGPGLFARMKEAASALPNVEFVGFVPHAHIESHFDGARLFVNTSTNEGFPNTFLQAWSRGIPTVSFCDTGSTVDGHKVPHVARDIDEMTCVVRHLMESDNAWLEAGERARRCVEERHTVAAAGYAYERLFGELSQRSLTLPVAPRASSA